MTHKIATREEWQAARAVLLEHEKEHTRTGDELAEQLRSLPWVRVEKEYTLQTADGPKTLGELFDGRSQLMIYHFMFGTSYQAGDPVNSWIADTFDSLIPHLQARDVTLIAVSGAPIENLQAYSERMGWKFTWASSYDSDFNTDVGFSSSLHLGGDPQASGSSRRATRSRQFSTSCRRSPSATPRTPAQTSTAT